MTHLDFEITSDHDVQERLKSINGVGKSTLEKINEILETGRLRLVDNFYTDDPHRAHLYNMMQIWGVGASRVRDACMCSKGNVVLARNL